MKDNTKHTVSWKVILGGLLWPFFSTCTICSFSSLWWESVIENYISTFLKSSRWNNWRLQKYNITYKKVKESINPSIFWITEVCGEKRDNKNCITLSVWVCLLWNLLRPCCFSHHAFCPSFQTGVVHEHSAMTRKPDVQSWALPLPPHPASLLLGLYSSPLSHFHSDPSWLFHGDHQ